VPCIVHDQVSDSQRGNKCLQHPQGSPHFRSRRTAEVERRLLPSEISVNHPSTERNVMSVESTCFFVQRTVHAPG
jgi:hypothetical protein